MDKHQLLTELQSQVAAGQIGRDEVLAVLGTAHQDAEASARHINLSEVLYYIGGGIVFIGIVVLLYQNWDSLNSFVRILVTLGSFIAALIVAGLLNRYAHLKKVAQAFFLISGLLAPLAANITLKETNIDINSDSIQTYIYIILTAGFFALFYFFRQTILLFFGILFATGLFHFILNLLALNNLSASDVAKLWEYQILVDGLAFMFLGYYLQATSQKALTGVLYGFGALGFLGAAIFLGGYSPDQNTFWELIYPLLTFGLIFVAVYVKSKSFLVFGTLFLVAYIFKLTGEYFSNNLGWPLSLVLAGFLIMIVGYYAVRINKKYLTSVSIR